jgi:hypothetical protein
LIAKPIEYILSYFREFICIYEILFPIFADIKRTSNGHRTDFKRTLQKRGQMLNRKVIRKISELIPEAEISVRISAKSGYTARHVRRWMNQELINTKIEDAAIELLAELKASHQQKVTIVQNL